MYVNGNINNNLLTYDVQILNDGDIDKKLIYQVNQHIYTTQIYIYMIYYDYCCHNSWTRIISVPYTLSHWLYVTSQIYIFKINPTQHEHDCHKYQYQWINHESVTLQFIQYNLKTDSGLNILQPTWSVYIILWNINKPFYKWTQIH